MPLLTTFRDVVVRHGVPDLQVSRKTMTATLQPPPQTHELRNMLHGISLGTYERLVSEVGERPALRMTYDQGSLEV